MINHWFYSLLSVVIVSLISLVGVLSLSIKKEKLKNILIYFVSFSAGALFGDVFLHLLPEIIKEYSNQVPTIFILVLIGIIFSFILEKIICWRHCHLPITKTHVHTFAYMNLFGDFFHNFLDGIAIAASYLINFQIGLATTLAVIFHEIPQEFGDFGVLLHGGFSVNKALIYNFFTSLSAVLGAIISLILKNQIEHLNLFLISFTAGNFIYIAGSDLIPELHKDVEFKKGIRQILVFILGILIMSLLLFIGK